MKVIKASRAGCSFGGSSDNGFYTANIPKINKIWCTNIRQVRVRIYSRLHISSDEVFSKILKKPSMVQKKWYLIWKPRLLLLEKNKKLFFFEKQNSKWPTKKKARFFQLRQFSKFLRLSTLAQDHPKNTKNLSLRWTASQPYRLSHTNVLRINQFY